MSNIEQQPVIKQQEGSPASDIGKLKLLRLEIRLKEEDFNNETDSSKKEIEKNSLLSLLTKALNLSTVPEEQEELRSKMKKLLPPDKNLKHADLSSINMPGVIANENLHEYLGSRDAEEEGRRRSRG